MPVAEVDSSRLSLVHDAHHHHARQTLYRSYPLAQSSIIVIICEGFETERLGKGDGVSAGSHV